MKRVLVTGGGTGIGAATAQRLARNGAEVTICGRRTELLENVVRGVPGSTHAMEAVTLDVTNAQDVKTLFARKTFDAIVCSAGTIRIENVFDLDIAGFDDVVRTNLTGTYLVCREAMIQMRDLGIRGSIVMVSSIAGVRGMQVRFPGSFSYVASKHAVAGLAEALAIDGRPHGIRVNCISPGRVDTEMARQFGGIPENKPDDVASIIETLLDGARMRILSGTNLEIYSHD